jgi:transcriptional regulator with XRE-family HTH domain
MTTTLATLLGKRIREARARSGLSESEFADMVGCCPRLMRYWCAGQRIPSVEQLVRIAVTADAPPSWLLMPLDGCAHAVLYGEVSAC